MFDSGICANTLVNELTGEIDVSLMIPNKYYVEWINSFEQLLYSEVIKEQKLKEMLLPQENPFDIESEAVSLGENTVRFEDIYTIYADNTQLIKSTLSNGKLFPNTFYKVGSKLGYNVENGVNILKIIYFVRPSLKTVSGTDIISSEHIMIPVEFMDLIKAKLRGEAYKLANENITAANWINEYNVLLETFKAWVESRRQVIGM